MKAKKLLSLLLTLSLLVGLLPVLALPAAADGGAAGRAQLSQRLSHAEPVSAASADELLQYLSDPDRDLNITLTAPITGELAAGSALWCTVRGAKSLDLRGQTVEFRSDAAAESTLLLVEGGAWLELYDSLGGGALRYDGSIQSPAQSRTVIAVAGTLLMNGGTVEAGHAEQVSIFTQYLPSPIRTLYWAQVTGVGVAVRQGGSLLMNDGRVYGRALAGLSVEPGASAWLNGGEVGGFGGGSAVRGRPTRVTGGSFFTSDADAFVSTEDQDQYRQRYPAHGDTVPEASIEPNAQVIGTDLGKTVVPAAPDTMERLDLQTLTPASPVLTVPEPARYYPELEGLWMAGAQGSLSYQWEIAQNGQWLSAGPDASGRIDVTAAWAGSGFAPEVGQTYSVRCTVVERIGGLSHTTYYPEVPFYWADSRDLVIVNDFPENHTHFFHVGDDVTLRIDAAGEAVRYQWELSANGVWSPIPGESRPTCTLSGVSNDMAGRDVRCTVSDASGSLTSRSCRLKLDTERVSSVSFTSADFLRTGVDWAPKALSVLDQEIRCNTSGVRLKQVRYLAGHTADGGDEELRCTYPGQPLRLELTFEFNTGVRPKSEKAKNLSVTLDGRRADGYLEMAGKSRNYESVFYWDFTTVGDARVISALTLRTADGAVGDGHVTSAAAEQSVGFALGADSDLRYAVRATEWSSDGEAVAMGTRFLETENYRVRVTLAPAALWRFSADTVVLLDGERCEARLLETGELVAEREVRATKEVTSQFTRTWEIIVGGTSKISSENYGNILGDSSRSFSFEPGAGEEPSAVPQGAELMEDALYPNPMNGTSLGVLHVNADFRSDSIVVQNNGEDGLVIYVDGNVTLTNTAGRPVLDLRGDTTITGPGRLTLVTENAAPGSAVPVVRLQDCALRIVDTTVAIRGEAGVLGAEGAPSVELFSSGVTVDAASAALSGLSGGLTVSGCLVDEPQPFTFRDGGVKAGDADADAARFLAHPARFATGVSLDPVTKTIVAEDSFQLLATVSPADATDKSLRWSSSDPAVATVSSSGLVTGLREGTAVVTAETADGGHRASCTVNVQAKEIPVSELRLDWPAFVYIGVGEEASVELRALLQPENATEKRVFWYIHNPLVASMDIPFEIKWVDADQPIRVTGLTPGQQTEIGVISRDSMEDWSTLDLDADPQTILDALDNPIGAVATITVSADNVPTQSINPVGESHLVMERGETAILNARVSPANASNKVVRWTSRTPCLTVDQSGNLTALDSPGGEVWAEAWTENGCWEHAVYTVSVLPAAAGVTLSAPTTTLRVGEGMQASAYVYPSGAVERGVTWQSSDPAVATVDADGVVTAHAEGTVRVTAESIDGGFTDSLELRVVPTPVSVNGIELSQTAMILPEGGARSLEVTVLPLASANRGWSWTSSDDGVAVVEAQEAGGCTVRAKGSGTATITFRTADGNRVARLKVTVRRDYIPVERIDMPTSLVLAVGGSARFLPVTVPANASEQYTILRTEPENGCVELGDGWVHGTAVGSAAIRVRIGERETVCAVQVVETAERLSLDAETLSLELGGSGRLQPSFAPAGAYDRTLNWRSSDEHVVTVDQSGNLTAVGYGTAWVTAEHPLSGLTAGCAVTVDGSAYALWIDGQSVTDENRGALCGGSLAYDPGTETLTVSGSAGSYGGEPLIRSEIDGLTILVAADSVLRAPAGVFALSGNTTVTGAGTLTVHAYGGTAFLVTDGAALTVRGAAIAADGAFGFLGAEGGEALRFETARVSVDAAANAVYGFDGGITLSDCDLTGGRYVSGHAVVGEDGRGAGQIEIVAGVVAHDFNGDGSFDAGDAGYLAMNVLRGGEAYPLGGQSGDLDDNGTEDLEDVFYALFGSTLIFRDPERPLERFVAAAYGPDGQLLELRILRGTDQAFGDALDFLQTAAQVRFFYLGAGDAPLADAGKY